MGLNKEVHTMSTQNIDTLDEFRKDMEREKSERRALFFKALGIDDDGRRHPVMTEEEFREFVKPDSEFIVVIYDSKVGEVYKVYLVETGKTHRHCQAPISVEPVDMKDFVEIADVRYKINSKSADE